MISFTEIMALKIGEIYKINIPVIESIDFFERNVNGIKKYSWHMKTKYIPYSNWPSKYKPVNSINYEIQFFKTLNGAKRNLIKYLKKYYDGYIMEENGFVKIYRKAIHELPKT